MQLQSACIQMNRQLIRLVIICGKCFVVFNAESEKSHSLIEINKKITLKITLSGN